MTKFEQLEEIAKQQLDISTLDRRDTDSDNFHLIAVWTLLNALDRAYEAGRDAAFDEAGAAALALDLY